MSVNTIKFVNELDHEIEITITADEESVRVSASGPASETEHVWTRTEATWLLFMLGRELLGRDVLSDAIVMSHSET